MEMYSLKCPQCNADLKVEDGINTFYCQYCGAKIILHGQSKEEIRAKVKLKKYQHEENIQQAESDHEIKKILLDQGERAAIRDEERKFDMKVLKICGFILLIFFIIGGIMAFKEGRELRDYYKNLEEKVSLIQTYVEEERFDEAMILVQEIHAKDNAEDEVTEQWETTRKELISQIEKARDESIRKNSISLPESSSAMKKKNFQSVVNELKDLGFTNIRATELDEKAGWFKKPGQVKSVSINGDTKFKSGALYFPDVPIYIYYYSLEK